MQDRIEKQTIEAILNRENVPPVLLCLSKILECNGMSNYESVCYNRILKCLDDEHVRIDLFGNGDILFDYIGLIKCEDILLGYISAAELEDYEKFADLENRTVDNQNAIIKSLRRCDRKDIKNLLSDPVKYFGNEELANRMLKYLRAELRARKPHYRLLAYIKKRYNKIVFYVRNYRLICDIKRICG